MKALASSVLCVLLTVATLLAPAAEAFPFGKNSGVVELSPNSMNNFLNTHKPVFIMFYAPWCGHCKTLHPDWEKFGKGVKDVVKVGAMDCDKHKEVGGQFGVKGFPTIKYWKMGAKKGAQPSDYQGQRSKSALHNAAIAEIKPNVKVPAGMKGITDAIESASAKKAIILFSKKTKSPPMFSVLSQSPHFKGKVNFVLVPEKLKDVVSEFGISEFPQIQILSEPPAGEEKAAAQVFTGKMEYTEIAKFLKEAIGESGEEGSSTNTEGGESEKKTEEKKAPVEKKPPRPATPVRPVKLTQEVFETFCSAGAPKVSGSQPFCMIFLGQEGYDLDALHAKYEREGALFFFADEADALIYAEDFQTHLQPGQPALERGDMIALRASKKNIKYVVWRQKEGTAESVDNIGRFIERALAGESSYKKRDELPKLRVV